MSDRTLEGSASPNLTELERLFPGSSEMAQRMRAFDWANHALGVPSAWPQSLKTIVRIILTSRQAMFTWWGKDLLNLYNDAYISVLGGKHPAALGKSAPDVWHEIWDVIGPRAASALNRNEGTYDESLLLIMERNGFVEETYFTFSYSPVFDDTGGYGGIFSPVMEESQRIVGERQLALLRELSVRTADARTWQDACTLSAEALAANAFDMCWALIYIVDAEQQGARLSGATGVAPGSRAAPEWVELIDLDAEGSSAPDRAGERVPLSSGQAQTCPWPLAEVLRMRRPRIVEDLTALAADLPAGALGWPATRAIALPIAPSGAEGKAGILVVGLNPLRLLDDNYQRFLDLAVGEIAAAIANGNAYAEERRRAEALAELDRAKTTFFSNVSHEFRTPLALMLGPIEDVLHTDLPEGSRRHLQMVQRNALRLLKLVNTLLDFARIEAARIQALYEPLDLAAFTIDLASSFRSAIERAGMRLVVDCPPLPELVFVDRDMWEKIVLNLLSNAFKFTFEGEIAVVLRWNGAGPELTVRDTGTGIPEDELPYIFERFHRVPSARGRTFEGTGIGLALVKELVRLHGGAISVTSQVDHGSTFTLTLRAGYEHLPADRISRDHRQGPAALGAMPYVEEALRWLHDGESSVQPTATDSLLASFSTTPAAAFDGVAALPGPGTLRNSRFASARILVADDNADMRAYLLQLLGAHWQVETVADGQAALDSIVRNRPDLILSDIMMPGLDGFELLTRLRADPHLREVPVILLSARAGDEARIEGMVAGADDYLVKPFSARELIARVGAHLELAQVRSEAAAALRESRTRLQIAIDAAQLATWDMDLVTRDCIASPRMVELMGLPEGQSFVTIEEWRSVVPEDFAAVSAGLDAALVTDSPFELEFRLVPRGSTETRWLHSWATVEKDSTGRPLRFIGVAMDVTERKLAERALQQLAVELEQQARRFDAIANAAEDFIYTFDTSGRFTYANKKLLDLWSTTAEEALGKTLWELNYPDDEAARLTHQVRQVVATRQPLRDETITLDFADGGAAYEYIFTPIIAVDGSVVAVAGISRDTTERRRFEQQLRESEERLLGISQSLEVRVQERTRELARSNKELDQFAYIASHDLKAPLRAVDHLANWISQDAASVLPAASLEHLEKLRGRIRRMERLLDDLLAYSRAGRHLHAPEDVDAGALVRDVWFMLAPPPGFTIEVLSTLPLLYTERVPLETVLRNLIGNAIKHHDRPEEGILQISARTILAPEIEGESQSAAEFVEFTITDNGPGIEPQHHDRIFQIFQSLKSRDQVEGSGMGLAVVKKTVENHGGRVEVVSDGRGATFCFTWPKHAADLPGGPWG